MNISEAFDAFSKTLDDIAGAQDIAGLSYETSVTLCDSELQPIGDGNAELAALIAGVIVISCEGEDRTVEFEGAIPVIDGEVISDEMIREVATMRASVKEFLSRLNTEEPIASAFSAILDEETATDDIEPVRQFNNKPFYIGAALMFIVLIAVLLLMGRMF